MDGITSDQVTAHKRYNLNHRYIKEVLNSCSLPDTRAIVTQSRMTVLRKQVEALVQHQRKLEQDIVTMEEKYFTTNKVFKEQSSVHDSSIAQLREECIVMFKEVKDALNFTGC